MFAPSLQIGVAVLAVVSMPLSIAALNHLYGGHASISPWDVARQVCLAQLLPLALGMGVRKSGELLAMRIEPWLRKISLGLLVATLALVLAHTWRILVDADPRALAAIILTLGAALAAGHWLGGPEPAMRTAVAISSAARNPGLALLVATVNHAPAAVTAVILAYLVVAVFGVVPNYFAGASPNSRNNDWKSCDWRNNWPAAWRSRSTSSGGSAKLVGRFMR